MAFALCLAGLLPAISVKAQGATHQELLNALGTLSGIRETWYDDFDGDGTKELFVSTNSGDVNKLFFSGEKWSGQVYSGVSAIGDEAALTCKVCKVGKKQKLFIMTAPEYVTSAMSYAYVVRNGSVRQSKRTLESLVHLGGDQFAFHKSCYDNEKTDGIMVGHTWKRYWVRWTGSGFKEYKAVEISKDKFSGYKGGASILTAIQNAGYTPDTIIQRANGIININIHKTESNGGIEYENVTVKLEKGKVTMQKSGTKDKSTNNIMESSYGGIYEKKGM